MNRESSPASTYDHEHGGSDFDDEEVTADYGTSSQDELPPLPSAVPSARSFDVLGSLLNFDTNEEFRKLYGYPTGPEASIQIAAASHRSDRRSPPLTDAHSSQRSDSLEIEVGTVLDSQASQDSQSSQDFQPSPAVDSVSASQQRGSDERVATIPDDVLWRTPMPLLSMRHVSMLNGQNLRFTDVNLDIARTGLHIVVCEERPCRRLLLATIVGGIRNGQTRISGHIHWYLSDPYPREETKIVSISASELMMTIEKYFQQVHPAGIDQNRELLSQLSLDSLWEGKHLCLHELEPHERRALSLLVALLGKQELLCMDDPLDGLSAKGRLIIIQTLTYVSTQRAVLITVPELGPFSELTSKVLWHEGEYLLPQPAHCRPISDHETENSQPIHPSPNRDTFSVDTGDVSEEESVRQTPAHGRTLPSSQLGPRGFRWLVEGKLAGTPEPGLLFDIEYDLSLLRAAGITMLVTLTEHPLPDALLEAHGLKSLFFPIVDMNVPSCRATEDLCALVEMAMERGEVIAFHCKAGLGRTGTLLVSYLIWEGAPPQEALEVARSIEPGWVQSDIQEQYLFEFSRYCESRRPAHAAT